VDSIKFWVDWGLDLWPAVVAIIAVAGGWISFGHRLHKRVVRCLDFSDRMHASFGAEAVEALSSAIKEAHIDAAVRECRVQIVEEMLGLAVYICDAKTGNCVKASHRLAELFGMDTTDMLGSGWLSGLDQSEKIEVWENWKKCVAEQLPYEREYTVVHRGTGEPIRCRTVATPARLKTGEIVWYVGIVERVDE
jgi:PAS domain S-box-containing protein